MTTMADPHTLTGAYALHALEENERAAFEKHLATCPSCAQEVREFSATAGRLALAATMPVPPHLKAQVLRQIGETRQDQPTPASTVHTAHRGRGTRWALAACLAGAAALGGTTLWQHQQATTARQETQDARQQASQIAAVLSAPDAKATSAAVGGGAHGSVIVSHNSDKAVFVASGLAKPPQGKVYQLWFADGDHMRPAGLLDSTRSDQSVLMTGTVAKASGMGLTIEPAGGSQQPTTSPLALMQLPA
ncbi:anti-sigma factor [Streptomyces sp. NPDC001661]